MAYDSSAYREGFRKAAEDAGLNPDALEKVALSVDSTSLSSILSQLVNGYNSLDPAVRHGLAGGLTGGLGALALSDGTLDRRLWKALAIGGLSGLGTYGLSRSGLWNKGVDTIRNGLKSTKFKSR